MGDRIKESFEHGMSALAISIEMNIPFRGVVQVLRKWGYPVPMSQEPVTIYDLRTIIYGSDYRRAGKSYLTPELVAAIRKEAAEQDDVPMNIDKLKFDADLIKKMASRGYGAYDIHLHTEIMLALVLMGLLDTKDVHNVLLPVSWTVEHFVEGVPISEIAERRHCSEEEVITRLRRCGYMIYGDDIYSVNKAIEDGAEAEGMKFSMYHNAIPKNPYTLHK